MWGDLSRRYSNFSENLRQSFSSLRTSPLRSVLTMTIVSIGLTALMGMLTVIHAISSTLSSDLGSKQGAAFSITSWQRNMYVNGSSYQLGEDYRYISIHESERFQDEYSEYGWVGLLVWVGSVEARRGSYHTRPYLTVRGVNRDFFTVHGYDLELGRYFTPLEESRSAPVVVIGEGIASQLFPGGESPLGSWIQLGSVPFRVVGVLASTPSTFGSDGSMRLLVPLRSGLTLFPRGAVNCNISVRPREGLSVSLARDHAERLMRRVRGLSPSARSNFNILSNDEFANILRNSMGSTAAAGVLIALITLLGSAVALMNIMLASVKERTREIGVRKAIGAHSSTVRGQFLIEAILLTVLGGLLGIGLGVLVGYVVSQFMGVSFSMPWGWGLGSLVLCVVVGVLAGYLPAKRAASLDPILALRYE